MKYGLLLIISLVTVDSLIAVKSVSNLKPANKDEVRRKLPTMMAKDSESTGRFLAGALFEGKSADQKSIDTALVICLFCDCVEPLEVACENSLKKRETLKARTLFDSGSDEVSLPKPHRDSYVRVKKGQSVQELAEQFDAQKILAFLAAAAAS